MSLEETTSSLDLLHRRCVELYQKPAVQRKRWAPRLFWRMADENNLFGGFRVDPEELEVLFSTLAGEASQAEAALEQRQPGRAGFIIRSIRHGELPLLTFRAG